MTAEQALWSAKCKDPRADKFVIRLWDGFDCEWTNVSSPLSAEEAMELWNQKTENGTVKIRYNDIDYYAIYPTTVKMVYSEDGIGPQR